MSRVSLKKAMCEAIVDGWVNDWLMTRVVGHAWRLTEAEPESTTAAFLLASEAVNGRHIYGKHTAKVWVARNFRRLNDMLWASRSREACIVCAQKSVGMNPGTANLEVKVRARDKRHDWHTVK